ncbi:MAG TPA: tripartite tricarboxylate transporter substrate binding protein, partial [Burkholderiaceae bacterium]|nr:tripartite tricarboxylate transporter substrate binding protein [Burkholderiaceae bacterium]
MSLGLRNLVRHAPRALFAAGALLALATAQAQQWSPNKPITIIVPWAAGGSTDQVTRVTAAELEKALNQKVVIVNQPGASGSIGTKNALEAPKDGYTWTAGAAKDLGTYRVLGMLDTSVNDWNLYLNVAHISVVGVNANAPYKDMKELLAAMKAKPKQIAVATAGVGSSGYNAIEALAQAAGVTYKHVSYDGGNPAVVATVAGETEVTTQLAAEQTEMIRAKRLRPLAVVGDKPLEIEGYGTVPPLSQFIPGFKDPVNYFGIFVPKGVPPEVTATLDRIWNEKIMKSEELRKYAQNRGALFAPAAGA